MTASRPSQGRRAYLVLLLLAAVDASGYSVIAPVIPAIARATHVGGGVTGALVACFGFGQLVGLVLGGLFLGRRSTAALLGVSLGLVMVGDIGFIAGHGLAVYFPTRVLQGIGASGLWLGVTIGVVERFPDRGLPRLMGILTAYSVGGVVGPVLGAVGGIRGPFIAHFLLLALCLAWVGQLGAPRVRVAADRRAGLRDIRSGPFLIASMGVLTVATDLATLEGPLPVHLAVKLTQAQIGFLYTGAALTLGISAMASARLPQRGCIAAGVVIAGAGVTLLGVSGDLGLWIGAVAVTGLGLGLAEGGSLGLLVGSSDGEGIILVTALWSQFWAGGYLFGSALSGVAVARLGFGAAGVVPMVIAILTLALLVSRARARGAESAT
ncbi:MAG TPA: MFS transporter [Solirubrobacteraceae bacterium]|nr:MFS transporter [Solirubrobacteraceae bacterium]